MVYMQSENLKHKRTFVMKLIILAPVITALMNIFAPLWFQINSFNWWYVMLYPGFLTLLCALIEQRDSGKLKYRAIFPLPVSLTKVWKAKVGMTGIYLILGNLLFLALNLAGGFIILMVHKLPLTVGVWQTAAGVICITLVSLWEVPLCLWVSKRLGIFFTVFLNAGVGSALGIFMATSNLWAICPYSWVPHLMIYVLGILPNGEPAAGGKQIPYMMILFTVLFALLFFVILTNLSAQMFERQEAR